MNINYFNSKVNELLQQLLLQVQSILSNQFIGMYIGGSLANKSFNHDTSDMDCYIVTTTTLSEPIIDEIEQMHRRLYLTTHPYVKKIEVSYIPKNDLVHFNPSSTRPYFNEGTFYIAEYGNNFIIELFLLREKGITIAGPKIRDLIKEISTQELKKAIKINLDEYWEPMLNNVVKLKKSNYQVFAVLTMCRTLYSLKTGEIASKAEAAQWVINKFDGHWQSLIEQAIMWSPDSEFNRLEETQQFIKYVLAMNSNKTMQ